MKCTLAVFLAIFGTGVLTRDVSNFNKADRKLISDHCELLSAALETAES